MTLIDLINEGLASSDSDHLVWSDGDWLSAAEVDARATQLANYLQRQGVSCGSFVGLCAHRSFDLIVGLLGILKAGAAYVPLDPDYPAERLRFMVEDAEVPVLLTQQALLEQLPETEAKLVCLDSDWPAIAKESATAVDTKSTADDLAYMIYTSGSTGRPKGAMNSNAAICNRLLWMQDTFKLDASDVVLQKTPFSFDVSVWELFWPLITGAKLVFPKPGGHLEPNYLADLIKEHGVSVLHFVPSMLQVFLDQQDLRPRCESIRTVVCSGEALSHELQERFFASLDAELHNLYGPTEAAVDVTHWPCQRDAAEKVVPIGWPVANTTIHILDESLNPVANGDEGELHIGGVQVGRGYFKREELTAERFISDPFSSEPSAKLYKSGDLARERLDGAFEYLGRIDFQVKIRGLRVELGEIEAILEDNSVIKQAAVLALEYQAGDQRLVAYYTSTSGSPADDKNLREELANSLPEYMVPQHFIHLQTMPTTPNGKLDRRALPSPTESRSVEQSQIADPVERFVSQIWADTLNLPFVNRDERFFEIGGTSLSAAKVVNKLQAELDEFIYVVSMFDAPTIAEYAAFLKSDYPLATARKLALPSDSFSTDAKNRRTESQISAADIAIFEEAIPLLKVEQKSEQRGAKNPPAIFILAPPRSGTTLLRVMLAGHPELFSASELQLLCFNTLQERAKAFTGKFNLWLEGTIRSLMDIHNCDVDEATRIMHKFEAENLKTQEFYGELQSLIAPKILVDKSPSYALDPGAMSKAERDFDAPIYVHLSRHPFGMVDSFERYHIEQVLFLRDQPYRGRQLGEMIWQSSHRNILEFLADIPESRQYTLRFEDMVNDPESAMRGLCERAGIAFDSGIVRPYQDIEKKMVDGLHADSIPMGDTRMLERKKIDPSVATAWKERVKSNFLSSSTWNLAERLGYARDDMEFGEQSNEQRQQKQRAAASSRRSRRLAARRGRS